MSDARSATAAPLQSLGLAPRWPGARETPVGRRLERWLRSGGGPGCLWIRGEPGSGRSAMVAEALEAERPSGLHALRVACWRGQPLEEVLEEIAGFLRQIGRTELAGALDQRSYPAAKLAVLGQCLEAARVVLWLDDVDELLVAGVDGGWPQEDTVAALLHVCSALGGRQGRVILVSGRRDLPGGEALERLDSDAPLLRSRDELELALRSASEPGRTLLAALAALPPEPSRQAVRAAAGACGLELSLRPEAPDSLLQELAAARLIRLPADSGAGGACLALPSPARRCIESAAISAPALANLPPALGAYYLRLAGASASLWHLVLAWRAFHLGGLAPQAYETQKLFLQTLIQRGGHGLARHVLEETVRTSGGSQRTVALGNLAILHKTTGDLDEALRLYEEVRDEFAREQDRANVARVLHQIGNTRYLRGESDAALSSYEASLAISTELGDSAVATATRIQIANIVYQRGDLAGALAKYSEALEAARSTSNRLLAAAVGLQIAQIHLRDKRYLEAEVQLAAAERCARESGDLRCLLKTLEAQGNIARERRDYPAARQRFDEALRVAEALGDGLEGTSSWLHAGDVERSRQQLAEALRCYEEASRLVEAYLQHAGSRGSASGKELRVLVEQRRRELEESVGPEAFARLQASSRQAREHDS